MLIDNSQLKAFQECPYLWFEKYCKKLEFNWAAKGYNAAAYGTRMHELLQEHYCEMRGAPIPPYEAHPDDALELEAQLTMASYRNHYPVEPFDILDVEKTFRLPIGAHEYTGKMDLVVRLHETGKIAIIDHKNEKRGTYNNHPKAWAARTQGTLYFWAGKQLYGDDVDSVIVNLLKRQSDKGQIGPEFSRQSVQRNDQQITEALNCLHHVADQIQEYIEQPEEFWASIANRNHCQQGNFSCEFYDPHLMGWSEDLLRNYKATVPYLDL